MGKQRRSDIYHKLDTAPKEKGTSSKYPANMDEGIFVRKAQFEKPLSFNKRNLILRKGQEKKKTQAKKVRFNPEVQELGNNPHWEDNLDEKWANLYMLATIAENANL